MRLLVVLILLASCSAAPPPSIWGPVITLGQTQQTSAPVLRVDSASVTASWIGADVNGVHHDARIVTISGASESIVLPLPPTHPYDQRLFPAEDGYSHLLWLDANLNGETQLFTARLSPDLQVERGPTPVTQAAARRYTAVPDANGGLTVIWSGGLLADPSLYMRQVDPAGRPSAATNLLTGGDWPALTSANDGVMHLFWYNPAGSSLHYATFADTLSIVDVGSLDLQPGDRLQTIQAGLDNTHLYLFSNVTRASGEAQVWYTSSPLDEPQWSIPIQVGVDLSSENSESLQIGFNSGQVSAAQIGTRFASWSTPLSGQFEFLPVATQIGNALSILYFQAGTLRGMQEIAQAQLIGPPALAVDQDRYLYLAWAQPQTTGQAALRLASLRFSNWAWLQP